MLARMAFQSLVSHQKMVRLHLVQVKDDRPTEKADIGFFDICVGDLPYGQTVEGWCATWRFFF